VAIALAIPIPLSLIAINTALFLVGARGGFVGFFCVSLSAVIAVSVVG